MGDRSRSATTVPWRRRVVVLLGASSASVVLVAIFFLTYLLNADLGHHRERIAAMLSDVLGYEVRIGELHIDVAMRGPARLEARHVTLVNRTQSDESVLAAVDRLNIEVELRPLLDRSIVIRKLELRGSRVAVEIGEDGRNNWSLPPSDALPDEGPPVTIPRIVVDRALVEEFRLTFGTAEAGTPRELDVTRLELSTDPSDMLQLHLAGSLDDWPLDLAGTIGPLAELMTAGDIQPDLKLTAGDATLEARGRIAEMTSLQSLDATLTAAGPEIDDITERFGLPSLGSGPFSLSAAVQPAGQMVAIELEAALGGTTATARGEVDSLTNPEQIDVTIDVQGPSLAASTALAGLDRMPNAPFKIAGGVVWNGFPLTLDKVEVEVGENRLDVDGILGAPPSFSGTNLEVAGEGPDLSAIGALVGVELPGMSFRISGHLEENEGSLLVNEVAARIGRNRLEVAGKLGELPTLAGTDLELHARGPSLLPFRALAGIALPDEPFEMRGRIAPLPDRLRLEKAKIRLGTNEVQLSGTIATGARFIGSRIQLQVSGDDLSSLKWVHRVDDLPAAPFRLSGSIGVARQQLDLDGIEAGVGDLKLSAAGRLATVDGLSGSELTIEISGRLPDVEAFTGPRGLPDAPFTLSGTAGIEGEAYRLTGIRVAIRDHEVGVDGLVVPATGLAGSKVSITLSGQDLADLGTLIPESRDLPPLPVEAYSLSGEVTINPEGIDLRSVELALGPARASIDGRLGAWPELRGADLTIAMQGPDGSLVNLLLEPDLPAAPLALRGRVQRHDSGAQFDDLVLEYGDNHLWLDGSIGEPPQLIGSDFKFRAGGPDLAAIGDLAGKGDLPAHPFRLEGHAHGSPQRFRVDDLALQIGETDVRGYLRLGLEDRKELEGRLESHIVDLITLLPASEDGGADTSGNSTLADLEEVALEDNAHPDDDATDRVDMTAFENDAPIAADSAAAAPPGPERRFDDEPFDLSRLNRFDVDIGWRIDRLRGIATSVSDLDLNVRLDHGDLRIGPFDVVGERGGRLSGSLRLEPHDESYDMALQLNIDDGWGDLTGGTATGKENLTHVDAIIDLHSRGSTPHQVAAGMEGYVIVFLAGGQVDDSLLAINVFSVLRNLLNLINPFADASSGPAELECAAFILDFNDSAMRLEPLAFRTQNVTIIGRGGVDLDTERINLEWVAKPRKGVGISTTTLTNPYIKLGGTLTTPSVDIKPVQAVTSTGLAVATAGLSLLGKGLWDRVTAEQKVCKKARKEAERRLAGKPARK